ncbi:hypothetical protein AAII07_22355 [Microvirga sp. 0TCS3.31]
MADIQLAPNNSNANGGALLNPYSPPAEKWRDLPLLALQSSTEVAAKGEVRLVALQAAFERERDSATAAQLQVAALQEQLANLQEKREEVLVLREQLADTEAHARQATGPAIAETEQKKLAEQASLKVTALQEEIASLSIQVLKARTTAESEKARAASALAQLEAVQHQLAGVAALQGDRNEASSHLRPNDDQMINGPALDSPRDAHPAELPSKLALPPMTNAAPSVEQGQVPLRSARPDKSEKAMADRPRQALSSIGIKPPAKAVNKSAAAPTRVAETDASRLTTPRHEPRGQSLRSFEKPRRPASQQPRLLAQDTQSRRDSGALSLPNDLLPDSRLW